MKEYTRSFKSGNYNIQDAHRYNLCEFEIMEVGITPKAQTLDDFLGKLFKVLIDIIIIIIYFLHH